MTEHQPARRRVAAFDFDGTITERDSLRPFLVKVCGPAEVYRTMAIHLPKLVGVVIGLADRDQEKERLITRLLGGRLGTEVREVGTTYARELTTGDALRPEMLEKIDWHRSEGHEIVIVSASLDVYLEPLAPLLGVDRVLCTKLGVDADGRLDGTLEGGNVRGAGKVERMKAWLGAEPVELWAYGDSAGDRELLELADHAVWVHGRPR